MLRLRVRSKAGISNITVDANLSLLEFVKQLQDTTKIPYQNQKCISPLMLTGVEESSTHQQISAVLSQSQLQPHPQESQQPQQQPQQPQQQPQPQQQQPQQPQQQLQQPQQQPQQPQQQPQPQQQQQPPQPKESQLPYKTPPPASKGSLQCITEGGVIRRKIADDNSCLFNAIGYVLEGDPQGRAKQLRSLVAHVVTNSEEYTEAMLGKSKQEYSSWITKPNSWGGGIEVSILSKEYQTEICTFDILSMIPFCYGEGQGYTQKVYLIYDGLHYDALAINLFAEETVPTELDITVFSPNDKGVQSKMAAFVESAHKAGQFTNMATFQLICGECNKVLNGEKQMAMHAAATGHGKFVEVKK